MAAKFKGRAKAKQSLYPDGHHTLAFYIKCVPPVGHTVVVEASTYGFRR